MSTTNVTIIGNLTAEPELRYTPNGAAVANFTIASTPRQFDKQRNEWVDGTTVFQRCTLWHQAAENLTESLTRGTRVIATGKLKARQWETKEGEKRTSIELEVEGIGPDLKNATAKVTRTERQNAGQNHGQNSNQWNSSTGQGGFNQPAGDPWATNQTQQGGQGGYPTDEPPF